jgi:hypothetical protein
MEITFKGDFEEIKASLLGLFGESMEKSKMYADQAAASAAKADSAARNSGILCNEIKKLKET